MIDYPEVAQRKIDAALKRDELRRTEASLQIQGTVPPNSTIDLKQLTTGARVGMACVVTPEGVLDPSWKGITWCAWVSDDAEVTIRLANLTGKEKQLSLQKVQVRVLP